MRTAYVYDRINKIGGAEKILQVLHNLSPESPFFTAVYHPQKANWANGWDIKPSFLNQFPLAKGNHEIYPWLAPLAFESFNFDEFDLVVSVTSAEAKGIITKPDTLHLCYCLTPTRYLWTDHDLYLSQIPNLIRPVSKPFFSYLKQWDKIACQRPDEYFAISETVRKRIKEYYGRESQVIYPPVDCDLFMKKKKITSKLAFNDYYLVVSRLVPYKKVELAVEACNRLQRNLVIVGTGVCLKNLKKIAGPTIYFAGSLTEDDLILYYQQCNALIFPQEEDFGITVVEAQAAGKPVIAYNKGGAKEILIEGRTGIFFLKQSVDSLVKAVKIFENENFNAKDCQQNAQRFSRNKFKNKFRLALEEIWKNRRTKYQ